MKLTTNSFAEGQVIPGEFAFGVPDVAGRVALGRNLNPQLAWSEVPDGVKSFALICHDPDAPNSDNINVDGLSIPADAPRSDFFHWVLVDLPSDLRSIEAGEFSYEFTPRGKPGPTAPHGARRGINSYTAFFANDHDMCGDYYGYDGPCPPWNDEIPHRYIFTLYALDLDRFPLDGQFDAAAVRRTIEGHVLAEAQITGLYSLNQGLA